LLRAQANERSRRLQSAAADYAAVYYGFPLAKEAKKASGRIGVVRRALGGKFLGVPPGQQLARAEGLYDRHHWRDARAEFSRLIPLLSGADRDRAALRAAQCRMALHASPSVLASLRLSDPEADAERLAALAHSYGARNRQRELLDTTERLAAQYPSSRWAEDALSAAGHFLWAQLDRQGAAEYYRRVYARFPSGNSARVAHWRIAWAAYLEGLPEVAELLAEHLRRFPGSPFAPDALYWLGRAAGRGDNAAGTRNFYAQLIERFPENYFARQAAQRIRGLGPGPANGPKLLSLLPPAAVPAALNEAVPQAAAGPWNRAKALRTIAFDASAELELRAAYANTSARRLLLEAAGAELAAGHVLSAITTARQVFPELESRRLEEGPEDAWRLVYPLVFEDLIEREASRAELDPMLVAGLIRQETAFQPEAVSPAGALGVMQLLPRTARLVARRLKLRYSRARLLQPEYNLRLGTAYLADLTRRYGTLEAALAAYNAGEDHVAAWQGERSYEEPAEFVESIPFRETRDYVLLVIRNAGIYRRLYGKRP
jgi:soluble lytic murein transglycosylase